LVEAAVGLYLVLFEDALHARNEVPSQLDLIFAAFLPKSMDRIGKPIIFNICMLGAVIGLTAIVRADSVINTLATRIPKSFLSMNRQALEIGLALTRQTEQTVSSATPQLANMVERM
jgi:hypothetical protein